MSVCCECCVLSGKGLCDELITSPEESYWLWCVVVCDLETSRMRRSWPALGRSATAKKKVGLMEKNDRTYRCSNTNYIRNVAGSSLERISGYLYWGFTCFSSVSEKNAMMVLSCMTHVVFPSTSWFQRLFITINNILFTIGATCVSALKSLDKDRRQTFPIYVMKAYMGSSMAPLISNLDAI